MTILFLYSIFENTWNFKPVSNEPVNGVLDFKSNSFFLIDRRSSGERSLLKKCLLEAYMKIKGSELNK